VQLALAETAGGEQELHISLELDALDLARRQAQLVLYASRMICSARPYMFLRSERTRVGQLAFAADLESGHFVDRIEGTSFACLSARLRTLLNLSSSARCYGQRGVVAEPRMVSAGARSAAEEEAAAPVVPTATPALPTATSAPATEHAFYRPRRQCLPLGHPCLYVDESAAHRDAGATDRDTNPVLAAGATRVADTDGMVMVYVPAGEFLMGLQTQTQRRIGRETPA